MILSTLFAPALLSMAAPTAAQLTARRGEEDIIPAYFQGRWGQSSAACADKEETGVIHIRATRIEGYELDAKVLKVYGIASENAPSGGESRYVKVLLAESGEGRVGIGTLVISRVGDKLYARHEKGEKVLTDAEQYADPQTLCRAPAR